MLESHELKNHHSLAQANQKIASIIQSYNGKQLARNKRTAKANTKSPKNMREAQRPRNNSKSKKMCLYKYASRQHEYLMTMLKAEKTYAARRHNFS